MFHKTLPRPPFKNPNRYQLSEAELDVLFLIVEGLRVSQIAARLEVSEAAVVAMMNSIAAKFGVASCTEAAIRAIREGMFESETGL